MLSPAPSLTLAVVINDLPFPGLFKDSVKYRHKISGARTAVVGYMEISQEVFEGLFVPSMLQLQNYISMKPSLLFLGLNRNSLLKWEDS